MRVRIASSTHYGTFDAELDADTDPTDLFDEGSGKTARVIVFAEDGTEALLILRKKNIEAVEVVE